MVTLNWRALGSELVLCHPFVEGELACGNLRSRARVLEAFRAMPAAPVATHDEAMFFLDRHGLTGRGIGWVDVHLLVSAVLAAACLWTHDRRLATVAADVGVAYSDAHG